jgi:hypothetical protein
VTGGRGSDPQDRRWFSEDALQTLRAAHEEIRYLLDRGYSLDLTLEWIGGHRQLSARQRDALRRATASARQCASRGASRLSVEAVRDGRLLVDGLNLVITLETALSGSVLIRGDDDVLRDLAGLRGSYRPIGATDRALDLLGEAFGALGVTGVDFLLDAPVSNSGELKRRILAHAADWEIPVTATLVPDADPWLIRSERVVSGDSAVLDGARSWFGLAAWIVEKEMSDAWIVAL